MKKTKGRRGTSVTMRCDNCGEPVKNVDGEAIKVICYRCVMRRQDPTTVFLDELDKNGRRKD